MGVESAGGEGWFDGAEDAVVLGAPVGVVEDGAGGAGAGEFPAQEGGEEFADADGLHADDGEEEFARDLRDLAALLGGGVFRGVWVDREVGDAVEE
ncbi:MAG: hypothetical protein JWO24_3708, partial [Rhodospirillales bacterium]|nr:hypothetical protein [Rhodospirillales bacterium]